MGLAMDIISINRASAILKNAEDGSKLGDFTISQLSTTYTMNGLPQCTAILTAGSTMDNPTGNIALMDEVMAVYMESGLHLEVVFDIKPSLLTDPNKKIPGVHSITLFDGVVTGITVNTRIVPYGNSTNGIVIKAYHKFAELYQAGSNGMVYTAPSKIQRGSSISTLIKQLNTNTQDDENSTNNMQSTVVDGILKTHVRPDGTGAGAPPDSSITTITKAMIDSMYSSKLIKGTNPDVGGYITGSAYVNRDLVSGGVTRTFIKRYLDSMWYGASKSSIGKVILTVLLDKEYLLAVAPRSASALTIIPDDGITIHKDHPIITIGMYNAINYNTPDDVHPDPDGVLITKAGSEHFAGNGKGYVIGAYPPIASSGSSVDIRWIYSQAPGWLADNSMVQCDAPKDKTKQAGISDSEYGRLCDKYAEWLYKSTVHKDNTVSLATDLRFIEAFKALGTVCEIDTVTCGTLKGQFFSYSFQFTQAASQSSVSIQLHFSHVEKYIKDNKEITTGTVSMCKMDDSDIIKKLPDITVAD